MAPLDICGQRLANQHLIAPKLEKASEIVRLLGAVQSQDYWGAKWAVGQRTRGITDAEVEREVSDGAILRTHVLRPTWHFVVPADIRWMLALTGPRVKAILRHYDRTLGVDDPVIRRSQAVMTKVLRGGKQLTRPEIAQALTRAGIRADGTQRLARIVMHAECDGLICSGARRGKQFTYALLEERVPTAKKLERDAALHELALRYFATRGPATADDFAWWSGLTKTDATSAAHSAESNLESTVIGGRRYWLRSSPPAAKSKSRLARLLPNYDEFFIGLKDRSAIQRKLKRAGMEGNVGFLGGHLIVVDGQIVGAWKRTIKGDSLVVALKFLMPLSAVELRAVTAEVAKLASFLAVPGKVEIAIS
jgi:hypothetical protein